MGKIPTKELELWLLGWSESHNSGCKVTFQVTQEDLEYFRAATVRKGKTAGQRYAAVLVQLTDDDKPDPKAVEPLTPAEVEGTKSPPHKSHFPGGLTGLAVRWCSDPHFQEWVSKKFDPLLTDGYMTEESAKASVCSACDIISRKELNEDEFAARAFRDLIMEPYKAQRLKDGVDA